MSRDKAIVAGTLVADIDGQSLFRQGMASGWKWQRDELIAEVPLETLIVHYHPIMLQRYVAAVPPSEHEWLRLHCYTAVAAPIIEAATAASMTHATLAPILVVARRGERTAASTLLFKRIVAGLDVAGLCMAARILKLVLSDEESARKFLQNAERRAQIDPQFVACADTWISLFGAEPDARRCLEKGVDERPDTLRSWFFCALLDDDAAARGALTKVTAIATATSRHCELARVYAIALADEATASEHLKQAETLIKNPADWTDCVEGWHRLIREDSNGVLRCLSRCKAAAKTSADLANCAELWEVLMGDREEAQRCLHRAEELAKSSADMTACAKGYAKIEETVRSVRFLERAQEVALMPHDWLACAVAAKELANDLSAATMFVQRAEALADDVKTFIDCARRWCWLLSNPDATRRCLQQAEAHASTPSDYGTCGIGWMITLREDGAAAHRCSTLAEAWKEVEAHCARAHELELEESNEVAFKIYGDAIDLYDKMLRLAGRQPALAAAQASVCAQKANLMLRWQGPEKAAAEYQQTIALYQKLLQRAAQD